VHCRNDARARASMHTESRVLMPGQSGDLFDEHSLVARRSLPTSGLKGWAALVLVGFCVTVSACGSTAGPNPSPSPATTTEPPVPNSVPTTTAQPANALPGGLAGELESQMDSLEGACSFDVTGNSAGCVAAADSLVAAILQDQNYVDPGSTVGQDLATVLGAAQGVDGATGDVPDALSPDASQLAADNTAALATDG